MPSRIRIAPALLALSLIAVVLVSVHASLRTPASEAAPLTSGGYTTSATVSPTSVARGGQAGITASVTAATSSSALVDLEVYDPAGTKAYQQFWDNQSFSAGVRRDFPVTWTVPATAAAGTYIVKIGIFAPAWTSLYHWNDNAASFSVTSGSTTPTPTSTATPSPTPGTLPALPAGWPSTLQIGLGDGPGGAAAMKSVTTFGFRYQYLAGGVNTGSGWSTWNANGAFVTYYIQDSVQNGIIPVFTYYMMLQSSPSGPEPDGDFVNMNNTSTMTAYWNDVRLFFQRAGAFPNNKVVLHVEPDLWGYIQQRSTNDDAATVSVKVGSTGVADVAGLPDNASGFARAFVHMRDTYAPNVILAYHISVWGTGVDIGLSNPPDTTVDQLGTRAATFYQSLGASFDIAFTDIADRDAGYRQYVLGDGGASWYDSEDFRRNARFLGKFVSVAGKRVVVWQIPLGNTKMLAMNNTWGHYQDNRVEWWLDEPGRTHLAQYRDAGVVAFLFGGGASGTTCACDAMGDGVTNPAPINGNTMTSFNADDDGGFFKNRAAAYYAAGAMTLSPGSATPTPTPTPSPSPTATPTQTPTATGTPTATRTPTPSPTPSPTATATPTRTSTPPPTASPSPTPAPSSTPLPTFSTGASVSPASIRAGGTVSISASVTSTSAATVLVDIEVYNSSGARVAQQFYDNQSLAAGVAKSFSASWTSPSRGGGGAYTVKIGIFSPGWGTLYAWNDNAAQFTVTGR